MREDETVTRLEKPVTKKGVNRKARLESCENLKRSSGLRRFEMSAKRILVRVCLTLSLFVTSSTTTLYALHDKTFLFYDVLTGSNVTSEPIRLIDANWGNIVICSPPMCSVKRAFILATSPDHPGDVVLIGTDITESSTRKPSLVYTTPFTDVNSIYLAGMLPTEAPNDLTFAVSGRGTDAEGKKAIFCGFLSVDGSQSQYELLFEIGNEGNETWEYDIEGSSTLSLVSRGPGLFPSIVAYFTLSRTEYPSGDFYTYVVAANYTSQTVGFCEMDWQVQSGQNLDNLVFDNVNNAIIGIGINNTDDRDKNRVLVRLRMEASLPPLKMPSRWNPFTASPSSCLWENIGEKMGDHPISLGGIAALVNRTFYWFGSPPEEASFDVIGLNADSGVEERVIANVCDAHSCFVAAGSG